MKYKTKAKISEIARNKSIKYNFLNSYKFLLFMIGLSAPTIGLLFKELFIIFVVAMITLLLSILIILYILKTKLIKHFERYLGIILYTVLVIVSDGVMTILHLKIETPLRMFELSVSALLNIFAWNYIQDFKFSLGISMISRVAVIIKNYIVFENLTALIIIDNFLYIFYFGVFTYLAEKTRLVITESLSVNLIKGIIELSKGLDQLSENLCLVSVKEQNINNLNLFHISTNLLKEINNSYKQNTNDDNNYFVNLLDKFTYLNISPVEAENRNLIDINTNYSNISNLLLDLQEFISSNNENNYKSNLYAYKIHSNNNNNDNDDNNNNCCYKFYEVKYVNYKHPEIFDEKFVIILFKNIKQQQYQIKNQQISTFGNVLVSSLNNEINNPLNGLYGQCYLLQKQNKKFKKIIQQIKMHYYNNNNNNDNSNNNASNYIDKLEQINEDMQSNIRVIKYIKKKINFVVINFMYYSKFKLKLPFTLNNKLVKLNCCLIKMLKILTPILQFNKIKLIDSNILIATAYKYYFNVDISLFKTLLFNICLIIDKTIFNSVLTIALQEDVNNKHLIITFKASNNNTSLLLSSNTNTTTVVTQQVVSEHDSNNNNSIANPVNIYINNCQTIADKMLQQVKYKNIKDDNLFINEITIENYTTFQ